MVVSELADFAEAKMKIAQTTMGIYLEEDADAVAC